MNHEQNASQWPNQNRQSLPLIRQPKSPGHFSDDHFLVVLQTMPKNFTALNMCGRVHINYSAKLVSVRLTIWLFNIAMENNF
jgi:hypothetical protein